MQSPPVAPVPLDNHGGSFVAPSDPTQFITDGGSVYPVNEVLLELPAGSPRTAAEAIAQSVNGSIIGFIAPWNTYQLRVPASTKEELDAVIARLRADPRVAGATKNLVSTLRAR